MKKKLLITLGALVALLLVAYLCLAFFLGSIVKAGVNAIGPKITGTKMELAGAQISPLDGHGTLSGLAIGNPQGWSNANAFYLGKVHVEMKPFSVFGDHIVVDEIEIDQPEILYETKVVSSNIGDLLKNIETATSSSNAEARTKTGQPLKFEVKHFVMKNGKVTVGVGVAALPLPLPPIELNNLGTNEGGITSSQLAFAVMRSVTTSVISATTQAAGKIGGTMGAAAGDAAKKAGESLKKLFERKK
ncbi:MAG TPA: hypothetical protein VG710_10645 [Opitutus sp.]|nr:hypothetical protein [Opitutus sp.]